MTAAAMRARRAAPVKIDALLRGGLGEAPAGGRFTLGLGSGPPRVLIAAVGRRTGISA